MINSKKEYRNIADEIYQLRERRQDILTQDVERDGRRQRIEELRDFFAEQVNEPEPLAYEELLGWMLVEGGITMCENGMTVKFMSVLDVEALNVWNERCPAVRQRITRFSAIRQSMVWSYCVINRKSYN